MLGTIAGTIDPVDRAFALAAAPRPRRMRFASAGGQAILRELSRLIEGTILPRRLTIGTDSGDHVALLVRGRKLVGVLSVEPADLWTGADLPAALDSDPEDADGAMFAEAVAKAISGLLGQADEMLIRLGFTGDGDEPAAEGISAAMLNEQLEERLGDLSDIPDRAALLQRFFDMMTDLPRLMIGPERSEIVPADTPEYIKLLFSEVGPANIFHKDGDPPEIVVFEQGSSGDDLTVKVADETRLCLVHANTVKRVEALMAATWQLKTALEQAAEVDGPGPDEKVH